MEFFFYAKIPNAQVNVVSSWSNGSTFIGYSPSIHLKSNSILI